MLRYSVGSGFASGKRNKLFHFNGEFFGISYIGIYTGANSSR